MRARRHCSLSVVSAVAISVFSSCNTSVRSNKSQVAAAENEIYEAVVHDMTSSVKGPSQLVFDDALLTHLEPGADMKSCEESADAALGLEKNNTPLYNSLADELYRLIKDRYDYSVKKDTIKDFLEELCTPGHLSRGFHTDLPQTFVTDRSVHFSDLIVKDDSKSFEQLFPGAGGIISFSHVGFDSTLHQAIVATSFICGVLCGSGHVYILQKTRGRWEVVNKWMVWVS